MRYTKKVMTQMSSKSDLMYSLKVWGSSAITTKMFKEFVWLSMVLSKKKTRTQFLVLMRWPTGLKRKEISSEWPSRMMTSKCQLFRTWKSVKRKDRNWEVYLEMMTSICKILMIWKWPGKLRESNIHLFKMLSISFLLTKSWTKSMLLLHQNLTGELVII